jgi:hypothetical protein
LSGERVGEGTLRVRLACGAAHEVASASAVPNGEHGRFQRPARGEKFFPEWGVLRSAVARPELHTACKKRAAREDFICNEGFICK